MKKLIPYIESTIQYFSYGLFVIIFLIMLSAFFKVDHSAEANIGNFDSSNFNEGWNIYKNNHYEGKKELPDQLSCHKGDLIIMKNQLPQTITDGMTLMMRTSLEDAYIYVDNELRESYASENFKTMSDYLPSAYILIPLSEEDAGKNIEIHLTIKTSGVLNKMLLGYGATPWFQIIKKNYLTFSITIFIIILGILTIVSYELLKKKININLGFFHLGLLFSTMGIWLLSESKLRQLIFARPSLTVVFSYLSLELISIFALLYFDEMQYKIHHKSYLLLEIIVAMQIALNIILSLTKTLSLHQTLLFSHIWLIVGIILITFNIILDIINKRITKYKIVAIGMGILLLLSIFEIISFYFLELYHFGSYVCFGLIFLLISNIIQLITDIKLEFSLNEKKKQEAWLNTIETISNAIDAKDEYTGGHSERVAQYAGILARELAVNYNFSENDIRQIRYIGLMHDIGKIGVADDILNKEGKLTNEEFSLMKKHVDIGSVLMLQVSSNINGLIDGIRYHHERFDGKGYPDGLTGINIPLVARILCLADSYDAMTSNRIYRKRLSDEEVKNEIIRCAGTQFDPALAEIFVQLIERGDIYPLSENELTADNNEKIVQSKLLSECLQKDKETGDNRILNPSHVRLTCYIMKLAELNKQKFKTIFIEPKETLHTNLKTDEFLENVIKKHLQTKDINIRFTEHKNLVVLFSRANNEIDKILEEISKDVKISYLF